MTFIRTITLALITATLATLLFAQSFNFQSSFIIAIIVFMLAGILLYFALKELPSEDALQHISSIHLFGSAFIIVLGFCTDIFKEALEFIITKTTTPFNNFQAIYEALAYRNILLELCIFSIGIFGPYYALKMHAKTNVDYRQLVWNLLCVAVLYLIALMIYTLIAWRIFAPAVIS